MELYLQLTIGLRLLTAIAAWLVWSRRRGRARRALTVAITLWAVASIGLSLISGTWKLLVALDTLGGIWLVLATAPRRPELSALQVSEAKFAAAFRHSLDSVILTAVPSGEVLEVNRGFTLITGIERQDAIGKTTLELDLWVNLDDRQRMLDALQRDGRIEALAADFNRGPDDQIRHGLLWGELIDVRGKPCLLTVVRDVTERLQRDRERIELIDELERKNEELEGFAYTVAHDLRSPLMSIQGFVDLAREDWQADRQHAIPDHLLRISGGAEQLQDLLDSLLALSRAGKVIEPPQPVALREVIDDALELLASAVRGSEVEITIADPLPMVWADRRRLLQVFQNLLANAIGCLGDTPRPTIEIGLLDSGYNSDFDEDATTVFVRDNGQGIEAEQLETIFELFARGSGRTSGTGIGLALVRRIVEGHGGRVWAESDGPGHGATFCFTLPTPTDRPASP